MPCSPPHLSLLSAAKNATFSSNGTDMFDAAGALEPTEFSWISPLQHMQSDEEENQGQVLFQSSNTSMIAGPGKQQLQGDSLFTHPFFIFVTCLSCVGNLAIIILIFSFRKFRKPANMLIANLSISSLLLMLSVNIRYMEYSMDLPWAYSTPLCRVLAVVHRIPIPLVALTTMAISFDRGRVARNPLTNTRTCTRLPAWRVLLIWLFSFLIAVPLGFSRKYDACIATPYKCSKILLMNSSALTVSYAFLFLFSIFIIPSIILVHESTKTLRKIRFLRASVITWTEKRIGLQLFSNSNNSDDIRLKLLRNSAFFSFMFLCCWMPLGFCQFFLDMPRDLLPEILISYVQLYLTVLKNVTYIQVVLNPLILFTLSYDFSTYYYWFQRTCQFSV